MHNYYRSLIAQTVLSVHVQVNKLQCGETQIKQPNIYGANQEWSNKEVVFGYKALTTVHHGCIRKVSLLLLASAGN